MGIPSFTLPVVIAGREPIRLPVERVMVALGYRVDPTVTTGVASLPLPALDQSRAVVDRRWTASGIPTGQPFAIGTQALQREVGLAVAGSPVHQGWWARLWPHTAEAPGRLRAARAVLLMPLWGWPRGAAPARWSAGRPIESCQGSRSKVPPQE